jgi:cytosine/adenosine deaminase-related metal-dependent hydrolase
MRILSADWVLPVTSPPVRDGIVVITDDKITAVGHRAEIEIPSDATVEEFGAAAIMPGFVNCHAHLELTIMRGMLDNVEHDFLPWLLTLNDIRKGLSDDDIALSALLGAAEAARAGVTCFGDVGRSGAGALKALKTIGLRGVVFQETDYSPDDAKADEYFETLKEKFFALRKDETALIEIGLSPHAPYTVCAGLFKKIAAYAKSENIKTTVHTAESGIEEDFMLRGAGVLAELQRRSGVDRPAPEVSTIRYLADLGVLETRPLLVHCVNVDDADIELIAQSGSAVAHCPKSNAKFGHGIAPLKNLLGNNVKVGIGSDSVASNNTCDLIEEARFASLMSRAREKDGFIDSHKILEIMTMGGARALGLEGRTGSLAAGKQADLAIVSLENIAQAPVNDITAAILFASNARDVIATVVAGKDIYRDGRITTVSELDIIEDVSSLLARISQDPK